MGVQRKTSKVKQYTPEFKREAVRLVTEGGLSMAQVARDLGSTTIRCDLSLIKWSVAP
jgi:transposase-like protein